jgi:hypothetical protein
LNHFDADDKDDDGGDDDDGDDDDDEDEVDSKCVFDYFYRYDFI